MLERPLALVLQPLDPLDVLLGRLICSLHNWALLVQTGTSTNALSKAAYDVAGRRAPGTRVQRVASAAGYLATELAKEAPYYAGAFGATLLSDSVSSNDALIFLAGANLGAAAYEYGLARLTRMFLRLRTTARGSLREPKGGLAPFKRG